jgi:uncharacterized protein with NRDE domain
MCILFSYLAKVVKPNEFKLVLLNNRDEFFFRPSKQASFINENSLYSIDLTPAKEGGTWLGMSKATCKIGCLVNLDRNEYDFSENKEGRGFLVPNFISSELSCQNYIENLKTNADKFNPFNLVGYERNIDKDVWEVTIFENDNLRVDKVETGIKINQNLE